MSEERPYFELVSLIEKAKEKLSTFPYTVTEPKELGIRMFIDGYRECQKEHEWHDIKSIEPSKEQLGKQLLIKMESVTGSTDYDYLVHKYTGESITDVPGVLAWKEIK